MSVAVCSIHAPGEEVGVRPIEIPHGAIVMSGPDTRLTEEHFARYDDLLRTAADQLADAHYPRSGDSGGKRDQRESDIVGLCCETFQRTGVIERDKTSGRQ